MLILGIDPGVKGGLALVNDWGVVELRALRPDMTETQLVETVRGALAFKPQAVYVENVQHMTGDGAQGSHTFGYVKGLLRGAVLMAGYEIRGVYPAVWQGAMKCLSGGVKKVTKRRAGEVFPFSTFTNATADAALIAEFGRRKELGLR